MSTAQLHREPEAAVSAAVNLLYICDFPPSHLGGGPILMSRLLEDYPPDQVLVLTSTRFAQVSPKEGRLSCEELQFPVSGARGRWGLGRLRSVVNWIRLPFLVARTARIIKRRDIQVMVTLLHGRFYLAAAGAALLTGVPYILVVHDDYVTGARTLSRFVMRRLNRAAVRNAAHIYVVSPEMRTMLKNEFGVESDVQRPAGESRLLSARKLMPLPETETPVIVYAGSVTDAVEHNLRLLVEVIKAGALKAYGVASAKLRLFTSLREEQKRAWGWDHPDVLIDGWIPQAELADALSRADILFLPFSFSEDARHMVETAFPSKTADYLASGRPILVFGPSYSSLVRYASEQGFAEVVTEFSAKALVRGIRNIFSSPSHCDALAARALEVFSQYHDIKRQRSEFRSVLNALASSNHAYWSRRV